MRALAIFRVMTRIQWSSSSQIVLFMMLWHLHIAFTRFKIKIWGMNQCVLYQNLKYRQKNVNGIFTVNSYCLMQNTILLWETNNANVVFYLAISFANKNRYFSVKALVCELVGYFYQGVGKKEHFYMLSKNECGNSRLFQLLTIQFIIVGLPCNSKWMGTLYLIPTTYGGIIHCHAYMVKIFFMHTWVILPQESVVGMKEVCRGIAYNRKRIVR